MIMEIYPLENSLDPLWGKLLELYPLFSACDCIIRKLHGVLGVEYMEGK